MTDRLTPTLRELADLIWPADASKAFGSDVPLFHIASKFREEAARREAEAKPQPGTITEHAPTCAVFSRVVGARCNCGANDATGDEILQSVREIISAGERKGPDSAAALHAKWCNKTTVSEDADCSCGGVEDKPAHAADDLPERLRRIARQRGGFPENWDEWKAADRIEALTARVRELEAALACERNTSRGSWANQRQVDAAEVLLYAEKARADKLAADLQSLHDYIGKGANLTYVRGRIEDLLDGGDRG